jgi:uracil-DNA glycosylase
MYRSHSPCRAFRRIARPAARASARHDAVSRIILPPRHGDDPRTISARRGGAGNGDGRGACLPRLRRASAARPAAGDPRPCVGQAPGTKVHETGIPWNDPSGKRLRAWLQLDDDTFYDEDRIAIIPMGFCYPGTKAMGGDAPPRPECAPLWQARLRAALPRIGLTLLVGQYAQRWYLGRRRRGSMTETVRAFRDYLPEFLPLPHPSWRTTAWQKKNPWFDDEVLTDARRRVHALIGGGRA